MIDEKDIESLEVEETQEEIIELTEEEKILIKIQELDVELEKYEDIMPDDMTIELYQEMEHLKLEIKNLKKQLKEIKKGNATTNSVWEKLNIWYIIYGCLGLALTAYPMGPLISAHYLSLVSGVMKLFNGLELSSSVKGLILFLLYIIYYLVFIGIDFLIYRFIKKNKVNLWTMVGIVSVHLIASIISICMIFSSFF